MEPFVHNVFWRQGHLVTSWELSGRPALNTALPSVPEIVDMEQPLSIKLEFSVYLLEPKFLNCSECQAGRHTHQNDDGNEEDEEGQVQ